MEKYISGQKNYTYEKTNIPVVMVDDDGKKTLKIGYVTLYAKFFMSPHLKNEIPKKNRKAFIYLLYKEQTKNKA